MTDAPITVQLRGGLGNQMFQYATARAAARRHGAQVLLDLRWFGPRAAFGSTLLEHRIQARRAGLAHTWNAPLPIPGRRARVLGAAMRSLRVGARVLHDEETPPAAAATAIRPGAYLVGYWQSEDYFIDAAELLRQELVPVHPAAGANADLAEQIRACRAVGVHVRRGDYLTAAAHGVRPLEYYREALTELRCRLADPVFFVFSDDPAWCREALRADDVHVVDHNGAGQEHEDLRLLSLCQAHVIANSSFSWWGAWLSRGGGPVLAPRQWFADPTLDASRIVPSRWELR